MMQSHYIPLKIRRCRMDSQTLRIAIIVRTKNRPRLLARCLQSLAEQERLADEVIVVNDGGVAVDEIVRRFAGLNIHLLNNPTSQGRARAGNVGVQASRSDVIGFLDDDDRFAPDHLQRLEKVMLYFDAKVAYSGCRLLQRDGLGERVVIREQAIGEYNEPYNAQRLHYENYIPLINLLIDRALWVKVGGFDETFEIFEDWDVLLRLSKHVSFYHLNRITTEYAIWGIEQITQSLETQHWRQAYRQFLEKHLIPLSYQEELKILEDYWVVSQQRRGLLRQEQTRNDLLARQLLQSDQELVHIHQVLKTRDEALKARDEECKIQVTHLQTQNEALHEELRKREQQYQQQYAHLQQALLSCQQQLSGAEQRYLTQLQEAQRQLNEARQRYAEHRNELEITALKEHERSASLLNVAHELSKRLAIGLGSVTTSIERYQATQPAVYALATTDNVLADYRRLLEWIQDKARHTVAFEQQLTKQQPLLQNTYQRFATELNKLKGFISASHWPQIRRYAPAIQAIGQEAELFYSQVENYCTQSTHLLETLGLATIVQQPVSTGVGEPAFSPFLSKEGVSEPPPRPLSTIYPTIVTIAGTLEKPHFMEEVREMGTIPFMLVPNAVLVFTTYCTLNNWFRFDLMLGTCLRINQCHLRVIIREVHQTPPLRIIYVNGMEICDNHFYPFVFEKIADSAGKTYQIEIDSPDARVDAGLAVWCHPNHPQPLFSEEGRREGERFYSHFLFKEGVREWWMQQGLLDVPLSQHLQSASDANQGVHSKIAHLFVITGIDVTTSLLHVHIFLNRLGKALEQAQATGKAVLCGQFSPVLQEYCAHWQLERVELIEDKLLGFISTESLTIPNPSLSKKGIFPHSSGRVLGDSQQAEYLWHCELTALPATDAVLRAVEVFTSNPDCDLLIPLEKLADGKISAGYALLMRDGIIKPFPVGASADHPYHAYRRVIEAANSSLITIRTACLSELDLMTITAYQTVPYQLTELIWQLKQRHRQTIYESALVYQREQPHTVPSEKSLTQDSVQFYQRWQTQIPTRLPVYAHLSDLLNPEQKLTILVIDATLPTYDEDSGSFRMYTLLKILANLGYRLTFLPDNLDSNFKYRHALEALGIEVFHGTYGIQDALAFRRFDFALICRVDVGQRYIPFVRLLSPTTLIFYDTVDIHYIREQRQAEIENNPALKRHAQDTKRKELANCLLANRVVTVTEADGQHLQQELPHLEFTVIPNIHPLQPLANVPFDHREGLVFIGNYNHQPNEDAVYYFVEFVLPKIHLRLPEICFYIIGSNMKEPMKKLANEHVKIIGWVDEVEPEFAKRRIFVSYLRYGAGMKGKLGQALSLGLPVVTTSMGAEGMGLMEGETALIADDPDPFAAAVCRLYTDTTLWNQLANQGRDYIEYRFGESAVRRQLQELFNLSDEL